MMVLGDCSGCETCGSQTCDVIAFLFGQGAEPMPAINYTSFNEGATPTLTVARLPDVFGYHGTPADYETNEGNPPPLVSGDYFYNYDDRTFWFNNGGTWEASPGPTSYGTGEVVINFAITRPECGCPHMWTADTGTLTWADGDIADKTITLTALGHAGTVPFWACAGSPYYGEAATCTLSLVSDDPTRCTNIGNPATLAAVCTHTVTNSGWGTEAPYQVRIWSAIDAPTIGRNDYNGNSAPTYLREDSSYDYDDPGTADGSGWREAFPHGNLGYKEEHYTTDTVNDSVLFRVANTGATSATERTFHDGSGQLTSELSVPGTDYPVPISQVLDLLDEAKAADIEGGEGYAWSAPVQEFVFKIRANNGNYDFSDPGFDSSKTYAYTGAALPAQPFDPAEWTEVADTGFAFEFVATTPQTKDFDNASIASLLGLSCLVGGDSGWSARCSTIDATRSATGSPYPYQVEIRLLEYYDFGTLNSTGSWIDITDTVYELDAPTTLGAATSRRYYTVEYRLTPLAGVGCSPTGSPTFVCHPGLTC